MDTRIGFALSNYKESYVDESEYPTNQLDIQFGAYPASGVDTYLTFYKAPVAMGPDWNPDSLVFVKPTDLNSIKITNNAYTYCSMKYGDSYGKIFTESDYYKTEITAWDESGEKIGVVEAYLAKDGNIVKEWIDVDLSSLKGVKKLTFKMDSSDFEEKPNGKWYGTPLYMCIGGFTYEI
ncbi:MAG: DUF4465 domain-containing protein [Marinifilaceae bacterium]|jgi:hypothetical protein|nr:DUF4465 domain-containing protein [Marinifilaceae bacterium]